MYALVVRVDNGINFIGPRYRGDGKLRTYQSKMVRCG